MAEFYIRQPDADEARGPYSEEQLQSLGEARQISPETLYYDPEKEVWVKLGADEAIRNRIFPERKSLSLKKKEAAEQEPELPPHKKTLPPIPKNDVGEMLAAAEGRTDETKHVVAALRSRERAASIAVPVAIVILILMIVSATVPNIGVITQIIQEESPSLLIQNPLLIIALIDTFLLICLCLAVTEIFPILRVRAMMGLGFYGFYYWAQGYNGDPQGFLVMAAALAANLGLFLCTLATRLTLIVLSSALGITGTAAFTYFMIMR